MTSIVIGVILTCVVMTRNVFVGAAGAAVILVSYALAPRGYAVLGRALLVKRRLWRSVAVSLESVRELQPATAEDFRGALRLWGNGGVFGYYGLFQTAKLGKCRWFLTNRSNAVVLVTEEKTVLVSPDDVPEFMAAVRGVAAVPDTYTGALRLQMSETSSAGRWVGGAIATVVLAIVGFAFLYAPGPPKLTLTAHALEIHDRFYPFTLSAADVDIAGIRVVDITGDPEWRPTARTNGFANAHYHSGWCRTANGRTALMYWADGRRLVLLPPKGNGPAVLVEATEPEKLVATIRDEWARQLRSVDFQPLNPRRRTRDAFAAFAYATLVEGDCLAHPLAESAASSDAAGKIGDVCAVSGAGFGENNRVPHAVHFSPACFKMLFLVSGSTSSPGCPAMVTRPGFTRCLYSLTNILKAKRTDRSCNPIIRSPFLHPSRTTRTIQRV